MPADNFKKLGFRCAMLQTPDQVPVDRDWDTDCPEVSTLPAKKPLSPKFEILHNRTEMVARVLYRVPMSIWAIVDAVSTCLGNYIGYQIFHIQFQGEIMRIIIL